jgi:hypothetical protein
MSIAIDDLTVNLKTDGQYLFFMSLAANTRVPQAIGLGT